MTVNDNMYRRTWLHAALPTLLVVLSALIACLPCSGRTCRGRVFIDANGNDTYDEGEAAVANCTVSADVSRGESTPIVHTDAEGEYSLQLPDREAVLFVVNNPGTSPSGKWWHYIEPQTADVTRNFALRRATQELPFYFVQGTDMHINQPHLKQYRRYLHHVNSLPVPVTIVVHTGDMIKDALRKSPEDARELYDLYINTTMGSDGLQPPVRNLMGNHEVVGTANENVPETADGYGRGLYREVFGPTTYAFRYADYHFIALDATKIVEGGYENGLTSQSAEWAVAYLNQVSDDAPVVLLVHEGLWNGSDVGRLRSAVAEKQLKATLYGHGHARTVGKWGGAPYIQGGAVSYAWMGFRPFPPQPRGYVLFRADTDELDYVFLDWAETHSFDVSHPPQPGTYGNYPGDFEGHIAGKVQITGVVSDMADEITSVECAIDDVHVTASLDKASALKKQFSASIDVSGLSDGVYDLLLTGNADGRKYTERQPQLILNGQPAEFTATGPAKLRFSVHGGNGVTPEVLVNGSTLPSSAVESISDRNKQARISQEELRRLNKIAFQIPKGEDPERAVKVSRVYLTYEDRDIRDVRSSPMIPWVVPTTATDDSRRAFYLDLVYDGAFAD